MTRATIDTELGDIEMIQIAGAVERAVDATNRACPDGPQEHVGEAEAVDGPSTLRASSIRERNGLAMADRR